jgi:uncharacterized protein YbjT (DUF2867 family)
LEEAMHILVTGATGFIGSHLVPALIAHGHYVTCTVRSIPAQAQPGIRYVQADFSQNLTPAAWEPLLENIDVVINAVGIIREKGGLTFDMLHTQAPHALFKACIDKGIKLIVQISALGADAEAHSKYHLSKKHADDFLIENAVPAVILQPSLVYGHGGASAALFNMLASMPVMLKFGHGMQMVQPVHIDDMVNAILAALHDADGPPEKTARKIAVVGPSAVTLAGFLMALRAAMGMRPALVLTVPLRIARSVARIAGIFSNAPFDRETFQMLERGNTADSTAVRKLLDHAPRDIAQFIEPANAAAERRYAKLNWLLPLLRLSIAAVWIVTGIISFGIYPVSDSYALLRRVGVNAALAPFMLYGAAAFDLAIGIAILLLRKKWLWGIQLLLIGFYSVLIAWKLPEFLVHPFGPLLKNLPMLAAIWLMLELEER